MGTSIVYLITYGVHLVCAGVHRWYKYHAKEYSFMPKSAVYLATSEQKPHLCNIGFALCRLLFITLSLLCVKVRFSPVCVRLSHLFYWVLCEFTNNFLYAIIWSQGKCTNLYKESTSLYKTYVLGYMPERKYYEYQ